MLGGNNYSGKFFEMTTDIEVNGVSVGAEGKPFSGTFSGAMHTLTYNRGGADAQGKMQTVNELCAPFICLDGATIRHLKVEGAVYSSHKFAAGIASLIDGTGVTTIDNCHVRSILWADKSIISDATFGGLVGGYEDKDIKQKTDISGEDASEVSRARK